jgi:hypothetical protein
MSGKNKVKVLGVVDGIEDGQDRTARIAKDMFDIVAEHHLVEDLTA